MTEIEILREAIEDVIESGKDWSEVPRDPTNVMLLNIRLRALEDAYVRASEIFEDQV